MGENGEIKNFIEKAYQMKGLPTPCESTMYKLFKHFDVDNNGGLDAVEAQHMAQAHVMSLSYYGYYGLGYHGLGYGLRAYGYGYPYAYGHYGYYGKRSADAEPAAAPEAEAAADPYYGYYYY